MPRGVDDLARDIHEALGLSDGEARTYLRALVVGSLKPLDKEEKASAESLSARGMLILGSGGLTYVPVHPRMALSNLFRVYEEGLARQRKEKRLLVDRLTLEMIALVEKSKRTNPGGARGERTATR